MERLKEIERKIEAAVERYKKEVTEIQNSKDDVLVYDNDDNYYIAIKK